MIAAALFLALATTVAIQERSRRVLERTHGELNRARGRLAQVKEASLNRRNALTTLKSLLDTGAGTSPELLIYGKADEIKAGLKPDDMAIGSLEKKEGNVSLPFTLKFTNPNYCDLLTAVSRLQQAAYPFTMVNSITLAQSEKNGKGVLEFTLTGAVMTSGRKMP
jgi:hypothetical protein